MTFEQRLEEYGEIATWISDKDYSRSEKNS